MLRADKGKLPVEELLELQAFNLSRHEDQLAKSIPLEDGAEEEEEEADAPPTTCLPLNSDRTSRSSYVMFGPGGALNPFKGSGPKGIRHKSVVETMSFRSRPIQPSSILVFFFFVVPLPSSARVASHLKGCMTGVSQRLHQVRSGYGS